MAPIARGGDLASKLRYFPIVFSVTGHDTKLQEALAQRPELEAARYTGRKPIRFEATQHSRIAD